MATYVKRKTQSGRTITVRIPLNAGELAALCAKVPADTPVLVPAPDHSYTEGEAVDMTALYLEREDVWTEDYAAAPKSGSAYGDRKRCIVIM